MDKEQLDLLEKEKMINEDRIRKLEAHKKLESENPTSDETMRRIERNLKEEYRKREGILAKINSNENF